MRFTRTAFLAAASLALGATAAPQGQHSLRLAPLFSDNMVLQRDIPAPVWGTAAPGEAVSVSFKGRTETAVADADGKWLVRLAPSPASATPGKLEVSGTSGRLALDNVLVGEVWLCSGQSNMQSSFGYLEIADEVKGVDHPEIRLSSGGAWSRCDTKSLLSFSCVGYYFGLKLWQELRVPVGLLNISRGCSSIEAWMPPDSLAAPGLVDQNGWSLPAEMEEFRRFRADYDRCPAAEKERVFRKHCQSKYVFARSFLGADGKPRSDKYKDILGHMEVIKPARLFDTLIAPAIPFGIRGVVWYQGETNVGDPQYARKQRLLVESWRKLWGEGDFPFLLVQVAPFNGYPQLPEFWLQQYEAARSTPRCGLAATVDIGELDACHPKNKRDVGLRLALLALRDSYGKQGLVVSGPTYKAMAVDGADILVEFDQLGSGLTTKDSQPPDWFEVAGADKKFVKAEAAIRGDKVLVKSPVGNPAHVRYGWSHLAEPNLRNREGLPALPFNTAEPFFQRRGN